MLPDPINVFPSQKGDLSNVQWTYLGIAAFVFCLAAVFFFAPIPEVVSWRAFAYGVLDTDEPKDGRRHGSAS